MAIEYDINALRAYEQGGWALHYDQDTSDSLVALAVSLLHSIQKWHQNRKAASQWIRKTLETRRQAGQYPVPKLYVNRATDLKDIQAEILSKVLFSLEQHNLVEYFENVINPLTEPWAKELPFTAYYTTLLSLTCPAELKGHRCKAAGRCYTFGRIHRCPGTYNHPVCQHPYAFHNGLVHILPTCRSLLRHGKCTWGAECPYGHDNKRIRKAVDSGRLDDEAVVSIRKGIEGLSGQLWMKAFLREADLFNRVKALEEDRRWKRREEEKGASEWGLKAKFYCGKRLELTVGEE